MVNAMVKFIRDIWFACWLPVWVDDTQLMRLCHISKHRLMELSVKLIDINDAIKDGKHGRLWNLKIALPALVNRLNVS